MIPEISIIVPVYNVEQYLNECVESILQQTLQDFELILIDDGSTDTSGLICDYFVGQDERVQVIHKENGGLSNARNTGLKIAKGKYVLFCDSDDFVLEKWAEELYRGITTYPDYWVLCNIYKVSETKQSKYVNDVSESHLFMDYFAIYKTGLSPYVHNKIYNMQIIKTHNIMFDEECRYAEDVSFNTEYYRYCKGGIVLTEALYYYRQNENSIMHTYNKKLFELHIPLFEVRLPLIKEYQMEEYCDIWLYHFIILFQNVFDNRNDDGLKDKLRYNQNMICSEAFQLCLRNASGKNENSRILKLYKNKNYYLVFIYEILWKMKEKALRRI